MIRIMMVYKVIKHRNEPVLDYKEPWMQEHGLNNFCTIVSEVSSFVGTLEDRRPCKVGFVL